MAARINPPRPKPISKIKAVERILSTYQAHVVIKVGAGKYLCCSELATCYDELMALADVGDPRYQGNFDRRKGVTKRDLMEVIE